MSVCVCIQYIHAHSGRAKEERKGKGKLKSLFAAEAASHPHLGTTRDPPPLPFSLPPQKKNPRRPKVRKIREKATFFGGKPNVFRLTLHDVDDGPYVSLLDDEGPARVLHRVHAVDDLLDLARLLERRESRKKVE